MHPILFVGGGDFDRQPMSQRVHGCMHLAAFAFLRVVVTGASTAAGVGPAAGNHVAYGNSKVTNRTVANSAITNRSPLRSSTMLDEVVRQSARMTGLASAAEKY